MSDLLAIVGPATRDEELLEEIAHRRPDRVTVLIERRGVRIGRSDESEPARAVRDRIAALLAAIERRTGASVVGLAGDRGPAARLARSTAWSAAPRRSSPDLSRAGPRAAGVGVAAPPAWPRPPVPLPRRRGRYACSAAMSATLAPDDVVRTHARGRCQFPRTAAGARSADRVPGRPRTRRPRPISMPSRSEKATHASRSRCRQDVVLRRPPRGPLPPSAHDVLREARLLRALEPTPVRMPRVLAVCEDTSVIGSPFYVMEQVRGTRRHRHAPRSRSTIRPQRSRIADELIDALVELHAVDWRTIGLEGFGKPSGYLERQLRRFARPVGAQPNPGARPGRGGRHAGSPRTCPSPRRRRSCTATTGSATRCSPTVRRRG